MRTAFVTGATRGAGRAIAIALAQAGWRVHALGRDRHVLEDLRAGFGIEPLAVDLTDRDELRFIAAELRVDALVHAALRWPEARPFLRYEEGEIDMTLEVNLSAALQLSRMMLPAMIGAGRGAMAFAVPKETGEGGTMQAAVRGALESFAQALRGELDGTGVWVGCVSCRAEDPAGGADRLASTLDARMRGLDAAARDGVQERQART